MRSMKFMFTNACVKMLYCPFHKTKKHFQLPYQKRDKVTKEKYIFFNAVLCSTLLSLYRRLNFFETLFWITVVFSFQVGCSSMNTPKYLAAVFRFISIYHISIYFHFINNDGSFKGILSFLRTLWKSVYLVLSLFRDKLFPLNHLRTLLSSKLAVW